MWKHGMIVLKIYNKWIQEETDRMICIAKGFSEDYYYFYHCYTYHCDVKNMTSWLIKRFTQISIWTFLLFYIMSILNCMFDFLSCTSIPTVMTVLVNLLRCPGKTNIEIIIFSLIFEVIRPELNGPMLWNRFQYQFQFVFLSHRRKLDLLFGSLLVFVKKTP